MVGLRARGALGVDLTWRNGRAIEARLRPDVDGDQVVRAPRTQRVGAIQSGGAALALGARAGAVAVTLSAGKEYVVRFDAGG